MSIEVDPEASTKTEASGEDKPDPESLKKAARQAVNELFAVNEDAWRPKILVKFMIHCPSGQRALVKHLDTLDLLEHDLIEELDFFTRKLFPAEIDPSGTPVEALETIEQNIWTALRDDGKRRRFYDLTGRLMATASIKPKIIHDGVALVDGENDKGEKVKKIKYGYQMTLEEQLEHFKKPIAPLPKNAIYSGYVDFSDRMEFFQELNKPLALIEPFRLEQATMLQDLARGQGHGSEA